MDLRKIRENKGYTQKQLGDFIKRDRSLITKIETDNSLPSVETAKAIAKVLDFDWTLFFKDVGEKLSHDILEKTKKESEELENETINNN